MKFRHQRLDVYRCALKVLELCDAIIERMPAGRSHLKDQLDRAVTSVVLNIAEGAGEYSRDEKRRFYRMARRSATEAAAILEILELRQHVDVEQVQGAHTLLARVFAMLVRMAQIEQPGSDSDADSGAKFKLSRK